MFSEKLNTIIIAINDPLWTYGLVTILLLAGIYFTISTKAVQIRLFPGMIKLLGESTKKEDGHMSSFQAFSVSIASRVGTGNIVGIATAIGIGGPGAVFWMWVIALLGMSSAFVESTLAQIYKRSDGSKFFGGPAYYIEKGLNKRWLGIIFAILISCSFGLIFNMVQANSIALALKVYHADPFYIGLTLAILTGIIICGGASRVAKFSAVMVPIMAVFYFFMTACVVLSNAGQIPSIIALIFKNAFSGEAALGGIFSVVMMQGIKRGLFSNEAGMGSAPNVAASAATSHPVKQGLIQSFSVFSDSMIICTCSAFMILIAGLYTDHGLLGVALTQESINTQIGVSYGNIFLCTAILIFAYTTIIGNYFYGESNIKFIHKSKKFLYIFRFFVILVVFLGSIAEFSLVWNLADLFMAMMTIVNIYAIYKLFPQVKIALKDYENQKKAKKNPEFHASLLEKYNFTSDAWEK